MGEVKSFRLNDRIQNMFNSIKKYYSGAKKITDAEIINTGIELEFENISNSYNQDFRKYMNYLLNDKKLSKIFNDICDILETLSFADGFFLSDEFEFFLYNIYKEELECGDLEKYNEINLLQYDKVLEIIQRKSYTQEELDSLKEIYQKYCEIKK